MTTQRFESALAYAHQVHQGQTRKGTGIPYIAHILGVAAIAMEYGADEDEAIGALLHDAAEDGGGEARLAEIRARFGDAVGDIVLGCSDSLVEDPEDKLPWRERKENYLAHVESATPSVCLVSAADKLHNVRAITRDLREHGDAVWERFQGRRDGTLWYYEAVAHALVRRYWSPLTRDLQREVDELLVLAES
ncbi:MAG: phosphohydrolase [Acidobacteria bacterium RIFCSPLOWO2_12_FULL_67_14b]|nr:MAG: phosphohydrolase [Acidobacteria bacterium RIFCSPLOWO2_12_FULL_67_14b]